MYLIGFVRRRDGWYSGRWRGRGDARRLRMTKCHFGICDCFVFVGDGWDDAWAVVNGLRPWIKREWGG